METRECYYQQFIVNIELNETTGCWIWTGSMLNGGYGYFHCGLAHRFSYEYFVGSIPNELFVLHNCPFGDNPSCVNPEHLWLGTQSENLQDMMRKKRHPNNNNGENNPRAKLTRDDADVIKLLCEKKEISYEVIANFYNVQTQTIEHIAKGIIWKEERRVCQIQT